MEHFLIMNTVDFGRGLSIVKHVATIIDYKCVNGETM